MILEHRLCCLAMAVCLGALVAHADAKFAIKTENGAATHDFDITTDTQIVFDNGQLVVLQPNDEYYFDIADITEIKFDLSSSSVESIDKQLSEDVAVKINSGIVAISSPSNVDLNIGVYSVKGQLVYQRRGVKHDVIDFNGKDNGVYIIKVNNKVIKFVK